jgi:subtilisin-like proprotein convertase family protein
LERNEWSGLGTNIVRADVDRNGSINREELVFMLYSTLARQGGNLSAGLPDWFFERDANEDGQIAMSEFAVEWTEELVQRFQKYDMNQDGIITTDEYLKSQRALSGTYSSDRAEIIPPRGAAISEIEVTDEYRIADIDVQLSITHTYASQLEGYLIGPDGQRIELFTGVGGSDDHFDATIFDVEAGAAIVESRPPFNGRYRPESLTKNEKSLDYFYGKNVRGTWQLMIRSTRNERSGVLHGWSIIVVPDDEPTAEDDPQG